MVQVYLSFNDDNKASMANKFGDENKFQDDNEFNFGKLRILYTNIKNIYNKVNEFQLQVVEYESGLIYVT